MALVQRRNTAIKSKARDVEPDDSDDEDEAPARSARRPQFKAPQNTAADDDGFEDEDEAPRRAFKKRPARSSDDDEPRAKSDAVQSGWGAAKKLKTEGGSFADEFSITNEEQLVKFMEDAPYAVYKQHWIEGLRSTKKRSFICLGKGCPLCAIGESAAKKWAFNVAVFEGDSAEVKSLIAGSRLFDLIADEHEGSDGPLDEGYWTLSKSGKKQSTTYKLKKVEGRKLEQGFGVTEDDLQEILDDSDLTPYTAAQHQPPTKSYLQEIADELTDGDD